VSRGGASARLRRMLSILPWLMSQPDGASIDDVCHRFDVTREQLLADLEVVWMVGVHPYSPDTLIDVEVEGDRVAVHFADWFRRPLKMTPDQALAVVATGQSLANLPGADPDGPLARAIAKVAAVLGVDPSTVEVDLGETTAATLEILRRGADDRRQIELDYYTYGRDELTHRVVDPYRIYAGQGQWYLEAYCHLTEAERIFRADRVRGATLLDTTFEPPAEIPELGIFRATPDTPRVVLDLTRAARRDGDLGDRVARASARSPRARGPRGRSARGAGICRPPSGRPHADALPLIPEDSGQLQPPMRWLDLPENPKVGRCRIGRRVE
jgi:proteasome accessory factor C